MKVSLKYLKSPLFISSLTVIFVFFMTILFFGPLKIFFSNRSELPYDITLFLPGIAAAVIVLTLLFTLVTVLLPERTGSYVRTFFLCLAFLFWLQGAILVWNYGIFDGDFINWDLNFSKGVLDLLIWILTGTAAFIFYRKIDTFAVKAAVMLFFVMTFGLAGDIFSNRQNGSQSQNSQLSIDTSLKYSFSEKRNIIMILLDSARSDIFYELMKNDKSISGAFDGFTYYPDALSGFNYTIASVPNILTGIYYDNNRPFDEYIKSAFTGSSIPKVLKDQGYRVELYPMIKRSIFVDPSVMSNISISGNTAGIKEYLQIFDVSLFRGAPHFLKKYIYRDNTWCIQRTYKYLSSKISGSLREKKKKIGDSDADFLDAMKNEIRLSGDEPVLKFYHFFGPHTPFIFDETGKTMKEASLTSGYTEGYKKKYAFKIKLIRDFLDLLKKNGIYDSSMIVINADHGLGEIPGNRIMTGLIGKADNPVEDSVMYQHRMKAVPLMLVKGFNEKGPLRISNKPVSTSYIPKIIFNEAGLTGYGPVPYGAERIHRYFMLSQTKYLNPLYEYKVKGMSWLDSSWERPQALYAKDGVYKLETTVMFGSKGSYSQYNPVGWGDAEAGHTRLGNAASSLDIPADKNSASYIISFWISPPEFTADLSADVKVDVSAGGEKLGTWIEQKTRIFDITVPAKLYQNGTIHIELKQKGSVSAKIKMIEAYRLDNVNGGVTR